MRGTPGIRRIAAATFLAAGLAWPAAAQAVRTWVSTEGLDTNPCTRVDPCRTFEVAIDAVNPGGEVVPLNSGGYGPFNIDKSVSVIVPKGIHAAIAAVQSSGIGVAVQAEPLDRVTLRGLFISNLGTGFFSRGIWFTSGRALHVESCVLRGFNTGILAQAPESSDLEVFVSDTTIAESSGSGIYFSGHQTTGGDRTVNGSVDRCRLLNNFGGVRVGALVWVAVRHTVLSGNGDTGGSGSNGASVSGSNGRPSELMMDHSIVTGNNAGIQVFGGGILRLTACSVTHNGTGVVVSEGIVVTGHSLGNNLISGNGTNVTGTLTVIPGK